VEIKYERAECYHGHSRIQFLCGTSYENVTYFEENHCNINIVIRSIHGCGSKYKWTENEGTAVIHPTIPLIAWLIPTLICPLLICLVLLGVWRRMKTARLQSLPPSRQLEMTSYPTVSFHMIPQQPDSPSLAPVQQFPMYCQYPPQYYVYPMIPQQVAPPEDVRKLQMEQDEEYAKKLQADLDTQH